MRAIQIALKVGCRNSDCPVDIDKIYVKGERLDGFYKKEAVYDYVKQHSRSIQVDLFPNPDLLPALTERGEKYVVSTKDARSVDYLMRLPRA
nr:DUF3892 domain-containing protein [uncultured Solibaculum sp.]